MIETIKLDNLVGAVMVIGGGIAGIQSSLDLADMGFKVYLVESSPSIGGKMAQLDKTFPTNDCAMCILAPKMVECSRHPNIKILTYTDVFKFEGKAGNFNVTVNKKAKYIDESKCVNCGTCAEKCPVRNKVQDTFDAKLKYRRAAYRLFPQAVPSTYLIDKDNCIYFKTGKCKACEKFCPASAVDFSQTDELLTLNVGAVIIASGMGVFDPSKLSNFSYANSPNIITSIEFERILSASGPFEGHVLRPSDKIPPKNVAFIQCVGSRDRSINRDFCSAACCMYAIKEAIIAKEHDPQLDITIFFMDIRAYGKEFDEYYEKAKNSGIKFIRSRPTSAHEHDNQIKIIYETRAGELKDELFDLVVLSVGFQQTKEFQTLSETFNLESNEFGFTKTQSFYPTNTNVDGVFVCGLNSGPKDIPDTVAQASGAVSKCASLLAPVKGTLSARVEKPIEEKEVLPTDEPRIGVIVCKCGSNIAGVVDVPKVVEYIKTLPNVEACEEKIYACSSDSQQKIKDLIKTHDLNRFIVASCTPRTHEPLFQATCKEAGLNPYLFEMVNIRDQDSWVHMNEPEEATEKAKDLIRMKLGKSRLLRPLETKKIPLNQSILVIGGGIAGIIAASEAEKQGFPVFMIEKSNKLGGLLNKIHYLFENENPQDFLAEKIKNLNSSPDIQVFLNSELIDLSGYVGNYKATIQSKDDTKEIEVGAIIIATGGEEYKPSEYFYGSDDRVVTGLELENLLAKNELRGKTFCFIQCVGSRNEQNPYCNRICCTEAVKNAIKIKETIPDSKVFILYRDIRIYGLNEKYYTKARDLGVFFINFEKETPPEVTSKDGVLSVTIYDEILKKFIKINPDKLILSVGINQKTDSDFTFSKLSKLLKVPLNKDGFFLEAHMKLRPVDFATDGIFLCGTAHWPKLIPECISQASAAAARACRLLSSTELITEGIISHVDPEKCVGCGLCARICPYSAIQLETVGDTVKAKIIEVSCKGCGLCGASCPQKAITMGHFTDEQLIAEFQNLIEVE